jgi:hypothetical protein
MFQSWTEVKDINCYYITWLHVSIAPLFLVLNKFIYDNIITTITKDLISVTRTHTHTHTHTHHSPYSTSLPHTTKMKLSVTAIILIINKFIILGNNIVILIVLLQ